MERDPIDVIAALGDPTRRTLYRYVLDSAMPVTRDAAAADLRLPRSTVAFHLDRLTSAGLLVVDLRRIGARSGPGAGRPAKHYRRADQEVAVHLPPRRYDLMGDLLATAIETSVPGGSAVDALSRISAERGKAVGAQAGSLAAVLEQCGYEPADDDGGVALRNCPFHALAGAHREVVCAANHAFLSGAAEATGIDPARVRLVPSVGRCCVRIDG